MLTLPSTKKLILSMIYESLLIFGIVFLTALIYGVWLHQTHALQHKTGLQISIFFILGIYFIYSWYKSGQTLAMKTWGLKFYTKDVYKDTWNKGIPLKKAILRYILCWVVWFAPSMIVSYAFNSATNLVNASIFIVLFNITCIFVLAHKNSYKQFLHDRYLNIRMYIE